MTGILLWILTSQITLMLAGGAGLVAVIASFFLPGFKGFVARWGGVLLLFGFVYLLGYRTAEDAAEAKAQLERAQTELAWRTLELSVQKVAAEIASAANDELRASKAQSDKKVADYEDMLAKQKPVAACAIDDADLRFRRSLRQHRAKAR